MLQLYAKLMYVMSMIIILMLYTLHLHMQKDICKNRWDSVVSVTNGLLISDFGSSTRREGHNSFYANHPQRLAHLVMFKMSVGRDPKNPTTSSMAQIQLHASMVENSTLCLNGTISIQNPQILGTISSKHDVIHTPAHFLSGGFMMTNGDCHILCARA